MSLTLATLLAGLFLIALGASFLVSSSAIVSIFKAMPRSSAATVIFFGGATVWFLTIVWNLSPADFGDFRMPLLIGFALVSILSFFYVPDFLAVRGLAALMLLTASVLLRPAFGQYDIQQRLFLTGIVYVGIGLAIYLAAVPYRMRDFLQWVFATRSRSRGLGAMLLGYGLLLSVIAFTY